MSMELLLPIALVQVLLMVFALVDLYRRDASQVVFGKKWPWVLVVLFFSMIGPLIYLIAGRKH